MLSIESKKSSSSSINSARPHGKQIAHFFSGDGSRIRCIETERRTALDSSWIKRLSCVPSSPPVSFRLPLLPPPRPPQEVVVPSEHFTAFGPFRVRAASSPAVSADKPAARTEASPFSQYRSRAASAGILNNNREEADGESQLMRGNNSITARESIHESPPRSASSARHDSRSLEGYAALRDRADDNHTAASRNFYNPHAFNLGAARHLSERQSYCLSREPEENFSYWDMGVERTNFVSSAYPVNLSTIFPGRKRPADTYRFMSAKSRRFLQ